MNIIKEILRSKLFYVVLLGCLFVVTATGFFVKMGLNKSLMSLETPQTDLLTTEYLVTERDFPKVVYEEDFDGEDVLAFHNEAETIETTTEAVLEETTIKMPKAQEEKPQSPVEDEKAKDKQKLSEKEKADTAKMWPVDSSDIVMDFSIDKGIYDKTLDQYRTNDMVSIKAKAGTQVKAYNDGTIKEIGKNEVLGNYIVIEHTDGLVTTYGQLQDNILVKKDGQVTAGQVIGGVSTPTKYSILLGDHLDFKMVDDGKPIDPKVALQ